MKGHTELRLAYRPLRFDDWGYVRDQDNDLFAIARWKANLSEGELNKHRRDKTDPAFDQAHLIVTAVNTYPAVTELVEALERLIIGATAEFNEKGAGSYALARLLSDARSALSHYRELAGTSNESEGK